MTHGAWITLAIGGFGLVLNLLAFAIGYGVLKGTVASLNSRVGALEEEMGALTEIKVSVAEMKTSMTFLLEQVKDMNASIRWLRDPAPYSGQPARPNRRRTGE